MQSLLDAYEHALHAFLDVAAKVSGEQWDLPTDCPGWTVRHQVAHVLALELQLTGGPLQPRLPVYPAHVRNPVGEHSEDGIAALDELSPSELVVRLRAAAEAHLAQLRAGDLGADTTVTGIMGTDVPLARFLPIRVFDVWTHEQDVRRAVGAEETADGPAAEVSRDQVQGALPYLVGKQASAPVGSSVAFDAPGPLGGRTTVTVGDDGHATATDGVAPGATVTLRMTDTTLMRLACGRLAPADADVDVVGDRVLARRVLTVLAVAP